jgi:hypothetical protein
MSSKKHVVMSEENYPTSNGFPGERNRAAIDYDNNTNDEYKDGYAQAGTRQLPGKGNQANSALTDAPTGDREPVRNAKEDVGACRRCEQKQEGLDGNPKHRNFTK